MFNGIITVDKDVKLVDNVVGNLSHFFLDKRANTSYISIIKTDVL